MQLSGKAHCYQCFLGHMRSVIRQGNVMTAKDIQALRELQKDRRTAEIVEDAARQRMRQLMQYRRSLEQQAQEAEEQGKKETASREVGFQFKCQKNRVRHSIV